MRPLLRLRAAIAAAASVALAGPAAAHAYLQTATPPVGSIVMRAPTRVTIGFTEEVEPRFSAIAVEDAARARVDDGTVARVGNDASRVAVGVRPLGPGAYSVRWQVTSVDAHRTKGSYRFTVAR